MAREDDGDGGGHGGGRGTDVRRVIAAVENGVDRSGREEMDRERETAREKTWMLRWRVRRGAAERLRYAARRMREGRKARHRCLSGTRSAQTDEAKTHRAREKRNVLYTTREEERKIVDWTQDSPTSTVVASLRSYVADEPCIVIDYTCNRERLSHRLP